MKYHNITHDDMLNGQGLRVVLWVSGCNHRCDECQNPITWDVNNGVEFDEDAEKELLDDLKKNYVEGVTFSGGDPLHTQNRDEITRLAKKIKDIIDTKSSFADWLNNQNVRNGLKLEIKICLVKNGYPPQYSPEVFNKVMEQVENFEEYSGTEGIGNEASTSGKIYEYKPEYKVMMVAEDSSKYGDSKNNQ